MSGLWLLAIWGATAVSAMLIAVLVTHSEVGSQRAAGALSALTGRRVALMQSDQSPVPPATPAAGNGIDPQAESRRLADTVRNLAADNNQLKTRLAAVENNISDFTGSVTRQVEDAKNAAARAAPLWPEDTSVEPVTLATIAALVSPSLPAPDSGPAATAPLPMPSAEPQKPLDLKPDRFGVDIGSALSIQALRARWAGIRSAHPQLFDNLVPLVSLRDAKKSSGIELRLVVGPVADAGTAAQLCASLATFRLFCQPTAYAGQQLTQ